MTKEVIKCVYPNGFEISKSDVNALKEFKKIILNYLKIERLLTNL